jgi:RNA polymerase sigma-70 factor (ECF subfamily)
LLVLSHQDRLMRIARRRLPTREDAEDCVQEALIRAACFAGLDEPRAGQFLTATLVRLCVDHHRSTAAARRALSRIHDVVSAPSPEDAVCEQAEAAWLLAQVDGRLSLQECAVVYARMRGCSTREAASQLQISHKAAEAAFTRARARMRALTDRAHFGWR